MPLALPVCWKTQRPNVIQNALRHDLPTDLPGVVFLGGGYGDVLDVLLLETNGPANCDSVVGAIEFCLMNWFSDCELECFRLRIQSF